MKTAILGGSSVGRARVSEVLSNFNSISTLHTLFNERHSPRIYFSFLHRFEKEMLVKPGSRISRRSFVLGSASRVWAAANLLSKPQQVKAHAPAIIISDKLRPTIP